MGPDKILDQIMGPPRPRMGEGDYAYPGKGPAGWDYDTLLTLMEEMGYNADHLDEQRQSALLDQLEADGATDNNAGMQSVEQFLRRLDPANDPVKGMLPMRYEDEDNGYWDARNMGNGMGESFIMRDGERTPADPIGKGLPAASEDLPDYVKYVSDGMYTGPKDQASLIKELLRWAGVENAARQR